MAMLTTSAYAQTITVTNSYANCREQAGASNKYMGRVMRGETYELLGTAKAPNNKLWYMIDKDGTPVFICSAFARINSNETEGSASNDELTLRIVRSCNVRASAGQYNKWLGRAAYGNTYVVVGQGKAPNGKLWYEIQYKGSIRGWVCSSFARVAKDSQPSQSVNSSSGTYKLTAEERELVERCVTTEAGGEPYEGQLAVAQVILNRARRNGQTVTQVITAPNQFAYKCNRSTTQSVKNAVAEVFDSGKTVLPSDTLYFCAPKYMSASAYTKFKEGKEKVDEIGAHVFFRESK